MKNYFVAILLFLISINAVWAQSIEVKGKIVEQTNQKPIEAVTVYLSRQNDSTLINYSITDKNGHFSFKVDKQQLPTLLRASFVGFAPYSKTFSSLTASVDLGDILLEEDNMLDEVIVKNEAPPIRIKNDTLEFNAASFRVRPDANVETLIKQLPGVEIDADGKITVNGKEVNQILVNGKPFFDKDGKVALQSLPSEIINKVQISDTKTKREEQTGRAATGNNASINLTIDEDKNKGLFGRVIGGYGSDDRYESSAMINYFRGDQKISLLAMANNINSTGFSMDEIFDNMGGGRNRSISFNSPNSFSINGMSFGGGQGITESAMVGLNYADKIFGEQEFSGSYLLRTSSRENDNRSSSINFLPDGNFLTESTSTSRADNTAHMLKTQLEGAFDKDEKMTYYIQPVFNLGTSSSEISSTQGRWEEQGRQTQDADSYARTDGENNQFEIQSNLTRQFARKGQYLSLDINSNVSNNDVDTYNRSENYFFYDEDGDGISDLTTEDLRNQKALSRTKTTAIEAFLEFVVPVTDSVNVGTNFSYKHNKVTEEVATFNFDGANQSFTDLNEDLTRYTDLTINTVIPEMYLNLSKKKQGFTIIAGTQIARFQGNSLYLGDRVNQNRTYILPSAHANYRYSFSRSKNIWANYNFNMREFSAQNWLPVVNLDNPQNQIVGNADLNPEQMHDFYFSFRNYDWGARTGYYFWMGGNYANDRVASYTVYDDSRRANTTFRNVDNVYTGYIGASYSWSRTWEAHKLRWGLGTRASFGHSAGFINGEEYRADNRTITPFANISYDYGEIFSFQPRYEVGFSQTDYTNFTRNSTSNTTHRLTAQSTLYWPKGFTFGNDFSYTYNTAIADGYQKGFYLWNISLGYSFWKDQLLAKVKMYDVLDQNVSATRTISENGIFDAQNTVLRQYVMFSLTYKFNVFGAAPEESRGSRMRGHF